MFGGGIVWLYRVLAGMNTDPSQPGYRHILFKPQPAGDIIFASYSNETPYGRAAVYWRKDGGTFSLDIDVPVGSTATVYVPATSRQDVVEHGKEIVNNNIIQFDRQDDGYAVFSVNAGKFSFLSKQ